jgi:hypothetical protein
MVVKNASNKIINNIKLITMKLLDVVVLSVMFIS